MWSASQIGYNTTREPQNTQARWLTEPAVLALPQGRSVAGMPEDLRTTCDRRSGRSSILSRGGTASDSVAGLLLDEFIGFYWMSSKYSSAHSRSLWSS